MREGYSLIHLGIDDYAFPKESALQVVSELRDSRIPVLGGDVFCLADEVITDTYDNWYCDPEEGETQAHFVERSYRIAKDYIENYHGDDGGKYLFSIIADKE